MIFGIKCIYAFSMVLYMLCHKCLYLMHVNLIMQLSFDLLESWLAKNSSVTHFKEDRGGSSSSLSSSLFRELALFQDYHGLPAFKKVRSYIICVNFVYRDKLTILIISVISSN